MEAPAPRRRRDRPSEQDALLADVLEDAIRAGEAAVERTPEQLDALRPRPASSTLARYGLRADPRRDGRGPARRADAAVARSPTTTRRARRGLHHEDSRFRYCTNFIVTGAGTRRRRLLRAAARGARRLGARRRRRARRSRSTCTPTTATPPWRCSTDGREITQIDVADMREQIEARDGGFAPRRAAPESSRWPRATACGALFEASGAHVVDGGADAQPVDLRAARAGSTTVGAEEVLVLPNSRQRRPRRRAGRRAVRSSRHASCECTSQQAGLAALVELDSEARAAGNAERLGEALAAIRPAPSPRPARDDQQGRFARGDAVGFVGDEIVAWGGAGSTLAATDRSVWPRAPRS